jgi:hypothetical protein
MSNEVDKGLAGDRWFRMVLTLPIVFLLVIVPTNTELCQDLIWAAKNILFQIFVGNHN